MTTELDTLPPSVGPLSPAGDLEPGIQHSSRLSPTEADPASSIQKPEVTPASQPPTLEFRPQTLDFKPRRRRGPQSKIAQLPAEQRNLVNQFLDEDKTYEQVVEEMARHGVSLNTDNVFKWFNGPYQDYLAALDWQDELQRLRDQVCPFGQEEGNVRFQEGLVQIGLTQIFRAMKEDRFKDDPANALRLFNSLARLSREALVIRKYADQQAKEKVQELRKLDPNRRMNEVEDTAMQDRSDDFFGWKSADRIKREMANQVRTDSTPSPSELGKPEGDCRRRGDESLISGQPGPSQAPSAAEPPMATPARTIPAGESRPCNDATMQRCNDPSSTIPLTRSPTYPLTATPPATRHLSLSNERCHECGVLLPPLLSSGERPTLHCKKCGTALRPPGSLIEYCPKCRRVLQELNANGTRPTPNCQHCNKPLPCPP